MLTKDGKAPRSFLGDVGRTGLGVIGGSLLSSLISTLFGIGATITQNQYNTPRAMRNRLKAAGLPLAYMYQGKVMGQSETPRLSIDPNIGVAQQRKLEQDQPLVNANVSNIQEETVGKKLDNRLKNFDNNFWMTETMVDGRNTTNRTEYLQSLMAEKATANFIRSQEGRIKELLKFTEEQIFKEGLTVEQKRQGIEKLKQQIKNMIAQEGLMSQLKNIRGFEEVINKSFSENLATKSDFVQGLVGMLMQLFKGIRL